MSRRPMLVFIFVLLVELLLSVTAMAQAPGQMPAKPDFMVRLIQLLPMLALLFLVFYLMVFKPQTVAAKKQQALLDSLKKGQAVVTSCGLIGRVAGVENDYVLLEIATNVKVKVEKQHIKKKQEGEGTAA